MIAVGIDPGTRVTGIVALMVKPRFGKLLLDKMVVDNQPIAAPKKPKQKRRTNIDVMALYRMAVAVCGEVDKLQGVNGDLYVAIEEPFVGANGATALRQHAVFSAIVFALFGSVSIIPVWPATIKKFVGAKKKSLLIREVYRRWNFSSESEDIVDAYAIARWCLETQIEPKKG